MGDRYSVHYGELSVAVMDVETGRVVEEHIVTYGVEMQMEELARLMNAEHEEDYNG